MSVEAIDPTEFLSAYLSGDASQDERSAVERWLASDLAASELLEELRELTLLLKVGDCHVTDAMIAALRQTIQTRVNEKRIKTLVAVSVTGDLTASEKNEVQTYLEAHPAAVAAQRQVAAVSLLLNTGQRASSEALAEKLRDRLKLALPAAALTPKVISIASATPKLKSEPLDVVTPPISAAVIPLPVSAQNTRQDRPSLRVYVAAENPWRKRAWALGGLAAMVALSVGARSLMNRSLSTTTPEATHELGIHDVIQADPKAVDQGVQRSIEKVPEVPMANGVPIEPKRPPIPGPDGVPLNQLTPDSVAKDTATTPGVAPKTAVIVPGLIPGNRGIAPAPIPALAHTTDDEIKTPDAPKKTTDATVAKIDATQVPDITVAERDVTVPKVVTAPAAPSAPTTDPIVAPTASTPSVASNTNTGNSSGNGSSGGSSSGNSGGGSVSSGTGGGVAAVAPPIAPTDTPTPIKTPPLVGTGDGNTIQPQDGVGVTGVIKGSGTVQVISDTGGTSVLKSTGDTVPSGATIVTDDAHLSLVLPGNGRLYIARFSNLKVTFSKSTTSIELNGGEIYYIAAAGGNLTLTATKATANRVVEGDLSLAAGRLAVLNFNDAAVTLTAKRQNSMPVVAGVQASVAVDGSSSVKRDPIVTLNGLWRTDVLVAGDGIKAVKKRN